MTVLVIAAHPDDEVLGCGATAARLASGGEAVHIVIVGEGATSRADTPAGVAAEEVDQLAQAASRAGDAMGARSVTLLGLPDNRLDTLARLDVIQAVEELIERHRPEVVFTHHGGDLNVDHRRVFEAVAVATRPMEGGTVREVLQFEVPSSTEWAFGAVTRIFRPSVFYDVAESIDTKIEAMRCYESEMRPFPHPRSEENLRAAAAHWGAAAGVRAAEAFEPLRILR